MDGSGDHNGRQQRDRDGRWRRDWTAADGCPHEMIGGGMMDSGVIDGRRRRRRRMDGGSDKTLLNLEVRHGVEIASIFGEKRPILCVTEKNTKKAIPISERGLPELISKSGSPRIGMGFIPIWGPTFTCICWYLNAQITNAGTGQRNTGIITSSGTGSPILDNSLVSSCLT
jgi:hypothetical protein